MCQNACKRLKVKPEFEYGIEEGTCMINMKTGHCHGNFLEFMVIQFKLRTELIKS